MSGFEKALGDIKAGRPVLVYDFDNRERKTDMTVASQFVTADILRTMRRETEGLICTTTPGRLAEEIRLPFMSDVFWNDVERYPLLRAMAPVDIPYDRTKSFFGITINHRDIYTGITDADHALIIFAYAETVFSGKPLEVICGDLGKRFRAPGHLLNTAWDIIVDRRGYTELCTAMMYMARIKPSATICKMMGDRGGSMHRANVERYAEERGYAFVTGDGVLSAWDGFVSANGRP